MSTQPVPYREEIPLTPAQLYVRELAAAGVPLVVPVSIGVTGLIDIPALHVALGDVIARHEILRTTISYRGGKPLQIIHPDVCPPELLPLPVGGASAGFDFSSVLARKVDLQSDFPLRAYIGSSNSIQHQLLFVIHHIAFDAWSQRPFAQDLFNAYSARLAGRLPEWPVQRGYSEFALGLRNGGVFGPPAKRGQLPFSVCLREPHGPDPILGTLPFWINPGLHTRLVALARTTETSVVLILQAALAASLNRLGHGDAIGIAQTMSGRFAPWVRDVLGLFQGTLLLRCDTSGHPRFTELLSRMHNEYVSALESADANPSWNGSRIRATVTLRRADQHQFAMAAPPVHWFVRALPCSPENFDLAFDLLDFGALDGCPAGIEGRVRYNRAALDQRSTELTMATVLSVLESVTADPSQVLNQTRPVTNGLPLRPNMRYMAPVNATQYRLVKILEKALGLRRISVTDDFLALGGNSEGAAKLIQEIEHLYEVRLPLADILSGVSVEELAFELVGRIPPSRVLAVRTGDPAVLPRFFYLHGDWSGGGYYARELARAFPSDQPFYLLHPLGMHGDEAPNSIERMAEHHVESLRAVQPHGPYHLGGYCIGGLIALEAARRLSAEGESVPLLILVHSEYLRNGTTAPMLGKPMRPVSPRQRSQMLLMHYVDCWNRYQPAPYGGSMKVLWAAEERFTDVNILAHWQAVCPNACVQQIPGTHNTCISEHADYLGLILAAELMGAAG